MKDSRAGARHRAVLAAEGAAEICYTAFDVPSAMLTEGARLRVLEPDGYDQAFIGLAD